MSNISIRSFFKKNSYFFILYALVVMIGLAVLLRNELHAEVLYFQNNRNTFLDWVFYVFTMAFEFPFLLILFVGVFFWSRKELILLLASYGLSSIITQGLKRFFAHPRPVLYFENERHIHLHSFLQDMGEELPKMNSFPSGHTTVAFAIFSTLAFALPRRYHLWLLLAAVAMGISRIYLACHFLEDVLVGSFIGVFSAVIVFFFLQKRVSNYPLKKKK